jgi:hypothetical protein
MSVRGWCLGFPPPSIIRRGRATTITVNFLFDLVPNRSGLRGNLFSAARKSRRIVERPVQSLDSTWKYGALGVHRRRTYGCSREMNRHEISRIFQRANNSNLTNNSGIFRFLTGGAFCFCSGCFGGFFWMWSQQSGRLRSLQEQCIY